MRIVRVASINRKWTGELAEALAGAVELVEKAGAYKPDIIALTEACVNGRRSPQPVPGPITEAMAVQARRFQCYIIVPQLRVDPDGTLYNVAVLIDPQGEIAGEYRKMFPTDYEMADGVRPGEELPVFETPFGRIGLSICFDLNFKEVIEGLVRGGAELVFFLSAYEGGRQLQRWALDYGVPIVSAHKQGRGAFIDSSGEVLQKGDPYYQPILVRDLNLDRKILHLDYNSKHIHAIQAKYGQGVHIDVYAPEGLFALESRRPALRVEDIMEEFGLETYATYLERSRQLRQAALSGEKVVAGPMAG